MEGYDIKYANVSDGVVRRKKNVDRKSNFPDKGENPLVRVEKLARGFHLFESLDSYAGEEMITSAG